MANSHTRRTLRENLAMRSTFMDATHRHGKSCSSWVARASPQVQPTADEGGHLPHRELRPTNGAPAMNSRHQALRAIAGSWRGP